MPSLLSTALSAITTDDKNTYLYYQNNNEILEAYSSDGSKWEEKKSIVATDGFSSGAAMTAYFVKEDDDYNKKQTVHVLYMNSHQTLVEKVRLLTETTWSTKSDTPKMIPDQNSRIAGGSFNIGGWNPIGSQWVYFNTTTATKTTFTEIRRTPKSPWYTETVLPDSSLALPATDIACTIANKTISLYYQDHDMNIKHWLNENNTWSDKGVIIKPSDVQRSTPLAAVNVGGSVHVLYVDPQKKIKDYFETKTTEIGSFYPGSYLAALYVNKKVVLFYRALNPVSTIKTKVYENGSWKDGAIAISA